MPIRHWCPMRESGRRAEVEEWREVRRGHVLTAYLLGAFPKMQWSKALEKTGLGVGGSGKEQAPSKRQTRRSKEDILARADRIRRADLGI